MQSFGLEPPLASGSKFPFQCSSLEIERVKIPVVAANVECPVRDRRRCRNRAARLCLPDLEDKDARPGFGNAGDRERDTLRWQLRREFLRAQSRDWSIEMEICYRRRAAVRGQRIAWMATQEPDHRRSVRHLSVKSGG